MLGGDSALTNVRPMGLRKSSPVVYSAMHTTIHRMDSRWPPSSAVSSASSR